jgi:hypothetical protein
MKLHHLLKKLMDLEIIVLSEVSQSHKVKNHVPSCCRSRGKTKQNRETKAKVKVGLLGR